MRLMRGIKSVRQAKERGTHMDDKKGKDGGKKVVNPQERKHLHIGRKRGGSVPGEVSGARPDRRGRGGTSDLSPFSTAGKMSTMDYEKGKAGAGESRGKGPDSDKLKQ